MDFQRLQRVVITLWVVFVAICLGVTIRQVITQLDGRKITAIVISNATWDPPFASWPRNNCRLTGSGNFYTVPNTIIPCKPGQSMLLRVDPLASNRAQFDGDIFGNGTSFAWYFLGASILFLILGGLLRLTRHKSPSKTAITWLIDRLQGSPPQE